MLTFNTILRHEGIEPSNVQLVRHRDNRAIVSCTPYNLWRAGDGRLELYQRIQKRKVFGVGSILATFVATPADETLFIGLYHVLLAHANEIPETVKRVLIPDSPASEPTPAQPADSR